MLYDSKPIASRRKVDEDRRSLDKVRAEATETANGMMQSVMTGGMKVDIGVESRGPC